MNSSILLVFRSRKRDNSSVTARQLRILALWFLATLLHSALVLFGAAGEIPAPPDIKVPAPARNQRVSAAAALGPRNAGSRNEVPVFLKVRVAPGFHIYALDNSGSANQPTRIEMQLPPGVTPAGPFRGPAPKRAKDGASIYEGEVTFWSILHLENGNQSSGQKLQIKLTFQACNELLCWPPESITQELELLTRPERK